MLPGRSCRPSELHAFAVVGNLTADTVLRPHGRSAVSGLDDEVRVTSERRVGGNAANTALGLAVMCRALPSPPPVLVHLLAAAPHVLPPWVASSFEATGVAFHNAAPASTGEGVELPASTVLLTAGARLILHDRGGLKEYDADGLARAWTDACGGEGEAGTAPTWVHIEGRAVEATAAFLSSRCSWPIVSLEVEKPRTPRDALEGLASFASLVFFSRGYAESRRGSSSSDGANTSDGLAAAAAALMHTLLPALAGASCRPCIAAVLPWGAAGAVAAVSGLPTLELPPLAAAAGVAADGVVSAGGREWQIFSCPAFFAPHNSSSSSGDDTLGAGDAFIASFLFAAGGGLAAASSSNAEEAAEPASKRQKLSEGAGAAGGSRSSEDDDAAPALARLPLALAFGCYGAGTKVVSADGRLSSNTATLFLSRYSEAAAAAAGSAATSSSSSLAVVPPQLPLSSPSPSSGVVAVPPNLRARLLFSNPVCVLTTHNSLAPSTNAMTVSWLTPVNNAGLFTMALNAGRHTLANLWAGRRSDSSSGCGGGRFTLSVAVAGMEATLVALGSVSGRSLLPGSGETADPPATPLAAASEGSSSPSTAAAVAAVDKPTALGLSLVPVGWGAAAAAAATTSKRPQAASSSPPLSCWPAGAADAAAHMACEVVDALTPASVVPSASTAPFFPTTDGHVLLLCRPVGAWVRSGYWHGGKCFGVAAASALPPPLTFLGSGTFSRMVAAPDALPAGPTALAAVPAAAGAPAAAQT